MESYGDCDDILFLIEGPTALAIRTRFRTIKHKGAWDEALEKSMREMNIVL